MGAIRNTSKGDIQVTTEAGKFVFPAGKAKGDLAAERIAEIEKAGAVYFSVGELVTEGDEEAEAAAKAKAKAEAEAKAKAEAEAAAKAAKKK